MATVADDVRLPSKALFMRGEIPEPLTGEERQWLWEQLHAYPSRVNEARTCAIGALTDMAVTEFCRLMAERAALERLTEQSEHEHNFVDTGSTGRPHYECSICGVNAVDAVHEQSDETMVERVTEIIERHHCDSWTSGRQCAEEIIAALRRNT